MENWEEEVDTRMRSPSPHSFLLLPAHPFPLPSFPFDECAWIFDLLAKEETVLQSTLSDKGWPIEKDLFPAS